MLGVNTLAGKITRLTRRMWTGTPSSVTPDAHNAWLAEQIMAYSTLQPFASPVNQQDNLTGETWEIRQAYRTMMKEPAISSPILAKTFSVCSQDPQVLPDDPDNPTHREAARWVDWSVTRSAGGWPGSLMEVAFPGQMDGFSVVEKVPAAIDGDHPKYPHFWTLRALKSKDTQYIRLKMDQYKNVLAIQAVSAGQGGFPFNPNDFILFTHLKIFQSPFGLSVMRPAYRAFYLIEAAIKLRSILLENYSGPYLVAKYTAGDKATETQLKSILTQARARGWITIPDGADVQVMNLATSAPDQFQNTIEDLRKEASSAMRGAYLQSMESKTPQGDSKTHKNETTLFDWYLSAILCSTLDEQLVPDLVEPNFGKAGGRPRIGLGGLDIESALKELSKFKAVQDLGVDLSLRQVVEVIGIESPKDDSDRIVSPAKLKIQEEMKKLAEPQPAPGGNPSGDPGSAALFAARRLPLKFADNTPSLGPTTWIPTQTLIADPKRFQFRAGHDEDDGTVREIPDEPFDLTLTSPLAAWKDPADRRWYIVDGHHRHAWASRDGVAALPVRPIEAATAGEAKRIGERINTEKFRCASTGVRVFADSDGLMRLADGRGFTGRTTDSLGRGRCYENGKQVKCGEGTEDKAHVQKRQETGRLLEKSSTPERLSTDEAKALSEKLWDMTVPELKTFERQFMNGPAGKRIKEERIQALIAWAGGRHVRPDHVRPARSRRLDNLDMGMLGGGTDAPGTRTGARRRTREDAQVAANGADAARRQQTRSPVNPPPVDPTAGKPNPVTPGLWSPGRGSVDTAKALFGNSVNVASPNSDFVKTLAAASTGFDGARFAVRGDGANLTVQTSASGLTATRTFSKDADGKLVAHMDYFKLKKEDLDLANKGTTGFDLFMNTVKGMRDLGVTKLEVYAAGGPGDPTFNGYYTWPRFGYDGPIPGSKLGRIPPQIRTRMGTATNIQALFAQPGGPEWWKANGTGSNYVFDLSDNSPNMKALAAYAAKRAANPRGE